MAVPLPLFHRRKDVLVPGLGRLTVLAFPSDTALGPLWEDSPASEACERAQQLRAAGDVPASGVEWMKSMLPHHLARLLTSQGLSPQDLASGMAAAAAASGKREAREHARAVALVADAADLLSRQSFPALELAASCGVLRAVVRQSVSASRPRATSSPALDDVSSLGVPIGQRAQAARSRSTAGVSGSEAAQRSVLRAMRDGTARSDQVAALLGVALADGQLSGESSRPDLVGVCLSRPTVRSLLPDAYFSVRPVRLAEDTTVLPNIVKHLLQSVLRGPIDRLLLDASAGGWCFGGGGTHCGVASTAALDTVSSRQAGSVVPLNLQPNIPRARHADVDALLWEPLSLWEWMDSVLIRWGVLGNPRPAVSLLVARGVHAHSEFQGAIARASLAPAEERTARALLACNRVAWMHLEAACGAGVPLNAAEIAELRIGLAAVPLLQQIWHEASPSGGPAPLERQSAPAEAYERGTVAGYLLRDAMANTLEPRTDTHAAAIVPWTDLQPLVLSVERDDLEAAAREMATVPWRATVPALAGAAGAAAALATPLFLARKTRSLVPLLGGCLFASAAAFASHRASRLWEGALVNHHPSQ
jgi:hypothetical protein